MIVKQEHFDRYLRSKDASGSETGLHPDKVVRNEIIFIF
jgi:hypothetical protein